MGELPPLPSSLPTENVMLDKATIQLSVVVIQGSITFKTKELRPVNTVKTIPFNVSWLT